MVNIDASETSESNLTDFDLHGTAPTFHCKGMTLSQDAKEAILQAEVTINNTMIKNESIITEESTTTKKDDDSNDFVEVTRKRKTRSSPGHQGPNKKTTNATEEDDDVLDNLYRKMG